MKRLIWLILFLVIPFLASGCGKGKEATAHKEGAKHEAIGTIDAAKKPGGTEMEDMKGMTMESIQKEGTLADFCAQRGGFRAEFLQERVVCIAAAAVEVVIEAVV